MADHADHNLRPEFDAEFIKIADYVLNTNIDSNEAFNTARYCLMDTLGCAMLALNYLACRKLLGPIMPGTQVANGARVPGTSYQLDPVQAAFNLGCMIRWLDFNDTWLAQEWGHPSDNIGGILAVADYIAREQRNQGRSVIKMRDVLIAMIKAHEIQGVLALENSFNRVGLDHVILVKLATAAVVTPMLGGNREQLLNTLSQVFVDGQSLRTYRHAPNTGSRKSWAAGDATSRAVRLALISLTGEIGYPSALSAKTWGFCDVSFKGERIKLAREFAGYVMENVLFKISYPAEFHAQTAVEAAIQLHHLVKDRLDHIEKIQIATQESAMRIINKVGPLYNPADRDHSLQYMVAIGLLHGSLTADHYEDETAKDLRIDRLREKMEVVEDIQFTRDYLDPEKRSIANSLQVFFTDGSSTDKITIEYPLGHRRRREQGIPALIEKFKQNVATQFSADKVAQFTELFSHADELASMPVDEFVSLWVTHE